MVVKPELSLTISTVSAIIAALSYLSTRVNNGISHTPIELLDITGNPTIGFTVKMVNDKSPDTIKNVSFKIYDGNLSTSYANNKRELLAPKMFSRHIYIKENIHGSRFEIKYESLVGTRVLIAGILCLDGTGIDFQNVRITLSYFMPWFCVNLVDHFKRIFT